MKEISDAELWLFIGALAMIDLIQAVLDLFAVGAAINRFVDIFVGGAFILYAKFRDNLDKKLGLSIAGAFVGEEIPLVDVLPLWTLDAWYFRSVYKAKMAAYKAEQAAKAEQEAQIKREEEIARSRQYFYEQQMADEQELEEAA